MNRIYRLIWSYRTQSLVAVAESTRGRGKRGAQALTLAGALAISSTTHGDPASSELPVGGNVVAGTAGISRQGSALTIQQDSQRAIIDWNSFNVGRDAQVNFVQPNAGSATLNRVLDSRPSEIFGRITANGQVFLTNPNGVYFSPSASVDVGGLVATTHSISAGDFMAGKHVFNRNGSRGAVTNDGRLNAISGEELGGYIALLAPEVRNNGIILARLGTAVLAAGESITLNISGSSTLASITVTPSQIRSLVENRHLIQAPGGLVILSAQAANQLQGGVVNNSGRLEATGMAMRGGKIVLEASSRIDNSGTIVADAAPARQKDDGTFQAGGPAGTISLTAPEIVNSGLISSAVPAGAPLPAAGQVHLRADTILQTASGRIDVGNRNAGDAGAVVIDARQSVELAGEIDARAEPGPVQPQPQPQPSASGGTIDIRAGRQVQLHDVLLDASGVQQGGKIAVEGDRRQPDQPPGHQQPVLLSGATQLRSGSRRGQGGQVTVTGEHIALVDATRIDAVGASGGGLIQVGGSWQNSDPAVRQARAIYIGAGTLLDASAREQGKGGTVVAWSDVHRQGGATRVYGTLLARGGEQGGDGGRIETSGHWVDVAGVRADASAPTGGSGEWLLDPYDLTVSTGATTATTNAGPPYSFSSGSGATVVNNGDIEAQLNSGTSVTLQTTGTDGDGFGNGDITVNANISKTAGGDATLLLKAHRDIVFSAGIGVSSSSNKLHLAFNSDSDATNAGMVLIDGGTFATNGGNITIGGGTNIATGFAQGRSNSGTDLWGNGVRFNGAPILNSAGGDIVMRGRGASSGGGAWASNGIVVSGTFNSGTGKINLLGVAWGDAGSQRDIGVIVGTSTITSASPAPDAIVIEGDASASLGTGISQEGINAWNGTKTIDNTGGGGITLIGKKGATAGVGITGQGGGGWPIGTVTTTGPVTVVADSLAGNLDIKTSGSLAFQPATAGTSIGIAGGAGTLQIGSGYFNYDVADITIGDPASGTITVGGSLTYKGPMALISAQDILLGGGVALTGAAGQNAHLTLWSDADASGAGGILLNSGSSITTNDGDVVMGGGANPLTDYAMATAASNNDGIHVLGNITAGTGNVILNGQGSLANGVHLAGGLLSANGSITIHGISSQGGVGGPVYGGVKISGGGTRLSTVIGNVSITGESVTPAVTGVMGINIDNAIVETTGAGNISLTGLRTVTQGNWGWGVGIQNGSTVRSTAAGGGSLSITANSTDWDLVLTTGSNTISSNGGNIELNVLSTDPSGGFATDATDVVAAGTGGNITVRSDKSLNNVTGTISGTGTLTVEPNLVTTTIGIAGGAGLLDVTTGFLGTLSNGFAKITIGRSDGTGKITAGAFSVSDNLRLVNAGADIELTGSLNVGTNTLELDSGGFVSETGAGVITAAGMELNGGGNFMLGAVTNDVTTLAGSVGALTYIDANALTIGTVIQSGITANGPVDVATQTGNLTVGSNISTTDASPAAVVLNAEASKADGDATGGNILISGSPTISVGGGGVAMLFSGSIAGSTGLTALVGSGSGNFRYNSDESIANFALPPNPGVNAIYREQPTLTATANNDSKTYDGLAYSGGNGITFSGTFVNGDTGAMMTGTPTFTGSSQGAVNAGSYVISPSGIASDLGYGYIPVDGTLTINQAPLTVTANAANKVYDGLAYSGGNGVAYSGFVNGETSAVLGGTLSYAGTSQGAVNAGSYTITPQGLTSGNYAISYVDGTLTVSPAPLQVALGVAANSVAKTYDGVPYSGGNGVTYSGFVNGDTPAVLSGTLSYTGSSQGAVNAGTYTITPQGLSSSNYQISFVDGTLTINPAPLTVTANPASKVYDGKAFTGGNGVTFSGLVNGETSSVLTGSLTYAGNAQGAVNAGSYAIAPQGLSSNNYAITYVSGTLTVNPASLTVTANPASKMYDGKAFSGGSGVTFSGLVNGETSSVLNGSLGYSGTAQGAVNAGSYAISPQGLSSGNYAITYVDGSLTVGKAPLTVTANNATKPFDGTPFSGGNGVSISGFVNGETSSVLTGNLAYGGSSQGAVNAGDYAITPQGLAAVNYQLQYVDGVLRISEAPPPPPPEPLPNPDQAPVLQQLIAPSNPTPPLPPGSNPAAGASLPISYRLPGEVGGGMTVVDTLAGRSVGTETGSGTGSHSGGSTPTASASTSPQRDVGPVVTDSSGSTPVNGGVDNATGSTSGSQSASGIKFAARQVTDQPPVAGSAAGDPAGEPVGQLSLTADQPSASSTSSADTSSDPARREQAGSTLASFAGGADPATTLDSLSGTRIEQALAKGSSPEQAAKAGAAFEATLTRLMSQGVPAEQALARAERVFQAVAQPVPSQPATRVGSVLSGGGNVANRLSTLSEAKTASGGAAFDKVLAQSLAKGNSFSAALQSARAAAGQADLLARVDAAPRSQFANGSAGQSQLLANQPASFQKAMDGLLASGIPPEQAMQQAERIALRQEALAQADAGRPSVALATGNAKSLPRGLEGGKFDQLLSTALARGMSMEEALRRAQQIDALERRLAEAEARNPASGFATGKRVPVAADPVFDRALANAISRGLPPEQAIQNAQRVAAAHVKRQPQPADALASGEAVERVLLGQGNGRVFRRTLGSALARGVPVEQALEQARRAEQANAFRFRVPLNASSDTAANAPTFTTADGKPLPSWLRYSPQSSEFVAVDVPEGGLPLAVVIQLGTQRFSVNIAEGTPRR